MSNELILRPNYPLAQRAKRETITFRLVEMIYRNFKGKAGPFNAEGERDFSILLDEELAQDLAKRGLNIKPRKKRDPDDEAEQQMFYLPVAVSYKIRPPRVYMVTGDGDQRPFRKTMLPQEMLHMMDELEFEFANTVVAISNYDVRGTKGKKAYLQSLFGHVAQDELEQEYDSVEDMILEDTEIHKRADVIEGEIVDSEILAAY